MNYDDCRFIAGRHYTVDLDTGCWIWNLSVGPNGYAHARVDGRLVRVHRYLYEHTVGTIPAGLEPDHMCRVRRCINPAHIDLVTHQENMRRTSRVTPQVASEIRAKYSTGNYTQQNLAEYFGLDQTTVSLIVRGKRWM